LAADTKPDGEGRLGLASPAFAADAPPQTDAVSSEAARKDGTRVWDTRRQLLGTPPKPDLSKPGAPKPGPRIG
jgi:hypothetical protein